MFRVQYAATIVQERKEHGLVQASCPLDGNSDKQVALPCSIRAKYEHLYELPDEHPDNKSTPPAQLECHQFVVKE